ncbi:MAG TPA: FHA domain-containing protein [Paraburkholderia sp.]|jgi:type VI secretion system protein
MSEAPTLTLTIHGASITRTIVIDAPSVTLGRGADCTVVLADTRRAISRLHACIEWRDGDYVLTDSGSNPTLVNGHILNVSREAVLRNADTLSIGEYLIEVGFDGPLANDSAMCLAISQRMSRHTQAGEPKGKAFDDLTVVRAPGREYGSSPAPGASATVATTPSCTEMPDTVSGASVPTQLSPIVPTPTPM